VVIVRKKWMFCKWNGGMEWEDESKRVSSL